MRLSKEDFYPEGDCFNSYPLDSSKEKAVILDYFSIFFDFILCGSSSIFVSIYAKFSRRGSSFFYATDPVTTFIELFVCTFAFLLFIFNPN